MATETEAKYRALSTPSRIALRRSWERRVSNRFVRLIDARSAGPLERAGFVHFDAEGYYLTPEGMAVFGGVQ